MQLVYLPINREKIKYRPDRLIISLRGQQLVFRTSYNPVDKAFYCDILTRNEEPILQGRRLVYGGDLFESTHDERIPKLKIVPLDPSGEADQEGITWSNFMRDVKPYIFAAGDS